MARGKTSKDVLSRDEKRLIQLFRCLSKGERSRLLWTVSASLLKSRFAVGELDLDRWLLDLAEAGKYVGSHERSKLEKVWCSVSSVSLGSAECQGGLISELVDAMHYTEEQWENQHILEWGQAIAAWREDVVSEIEKAS